MAEGLPGGGAQSWGQSGDRTLPNFLLGLAHTSPPARKESAAILAFLCGVGRDTLDPQPIAFLLTVRFMPDILSQDALSRR
jgi:hypothetical protein